MLAWEQKARRAKQHCTNTGKIIRKEGNKQNDTKSMLQMAKLLCFWTNGHELVPISLETHGKTANADDCSPTFAILSSL
jgi:hypothetical protein